MSTQKNEPAHSGDPLLRSRLNLPSIVLMLLCAGIMVLSLSCLRIVVAEGPSMEPTYTANDTLLFMRRFSGSLHTGDVVLIHRTDGRRLIKRVAFLPGEEVKIYRDGLLELYGYWGSNIVPEGYVFVLGDNPGDSWDSRYSEFGLVALDEIWGTALYPKREKP